MKFALFIVCCMAAAALALDADAGHFIPKAFYRIDADGHKSDVQAVSPHIAHYLRRLRRDTVSSSSSSSSSVSAGDGQVYFTSQQVVHQQPDFGVASRFGGAPQATGHIVSTSGIVDNTGRVHYRQEHGQINGNQYVPQGSFQYPQH